MALDLTDKTANGNNLTNNGAAEYTTSLPFAGCTTAAEFVASETDYMYVNDTASLSLTGDFTLETWARFTTTPGSGAYTLLSKFNDVGGAFYTYIWQLRKNASLQTWMNYSADGASTSPQGVNWTPSTSTWYHMALTFKASTKKINFYINGSLQGTEQTGAYGSIYDNSKPFTIGAWDIDGTVADKMNGQMTDMRVWNVVRTATEINNNKAVHLTGSESGLVAYWPMHSLVTASVKDMIQLGIIKQPR